MRDVSVSTIGFTRTTAENFFARLKRAGVRRVIDVRLHNTSQLAGFAKADDLRYFLKEILGIAYVHEPLLAPTETMLKAYKNQRGDWDDYAVQFRGLMQRREIERKIDPQSLQGACLLCSEDKPHRCHRRLVCEYLDEKWNGVLDVRHL